MVNSLSSQVETRTRISFFRSMRGTLILLFLAVSLIPLITVGVLAYTQAQQALETEAISKLVAVRDIKAEWITSYFNERLGDIKVLSANPSTVAAMRTFDVAVEDSMKELNTDEVGAMNHYRSLYLGKPDQADARDGSDYSVVHARYHPMFKEYQEEYGYYDIFLVEPHSGNIIYSVFKEADFGTSLKSGQDADTNIAEAFRKMATASSREAVTIEDFADYEPSQGAAAFVASPIFDGAELIGVLIFQLPIDQINTIMEDKNVTSQTREAYLIGADKLMRSDSRFSEQSTILKREIDTVTANKALNGQTGVEITPDYRGIEVLSAYAPLNIKGVQWAILAEIDETEAFAPAQQMLLVMLIIMVVGAVVVAAVAFVAANSLAKPVLAVTEIARKLAGGDVKQTIEVKSRNEIGVMADAFRQMIAYQQEMAQVGGLLAQGDVSVDVTPQSEQDVLGIAFTQMIAYQQQMAQAAARLALGDVSADVTPQSEKDLMGHAFTRMITYQQQVAEAAGHLALGDVTADVSPQSEKDALGHAFTQMIAYQQQIAGVAAQMAEGDLTASVTPQSEKDALGNAFQRMIANLGALIGQVQQSADQVASSSQQLNATADQASQAGQQVATTIQQVAQGTSQQTQSVTEATTNVEQMSRSAEGIARGAQEQANGVQKTSELINEVSGIVGQVGQRAGSVSEANAKVAQAARHGVAAVEQTGQGMETIRSRTTIAAEKIKDMSIRSKEIGRIVETIDDIADKTDMLALNAAVEAARAGEHGRGFAVVADQVRKLSEDSKEATRDINDLIERVQETVNEAIAAMESVTTEVGNGSRLAGDTTQSLQDILKAAEGAAAMAEQINEAVAQLKTKNEGVVTAVETVSVVIEENTAVAEQMAANSQQITATMESVAGIAEENSASTEEVSALAEEMSAQTEEAVASAEELSALAEELQAATAQFRVEETGWVERERSGNGAGVAVPSNGRQSQTTPVLAGQQGN